MCERGAGGPCSGKQTVLLCAHILPPTTAVPGAFLLLSPRVSWEGPLHREMLLANNEEFNLLLLYKP